MAFDLANVVNTADEYTAEGILVHGVPGVGKTTFGCTFPAPILLRTERGSEAVSVPAFPGLAQSYEDVVEALNALMGGNHPYKTLVFDSVDWLEPLVWDYTCRRLEIDSIESAGFGKGYVEADADWRCLLGGFDELRCSTGMHVVVIAHTEVKRFDPPDSDSYDRYQIKLHKRAMALLQEWAGTVAFVNYRKALELTKKNNKDKTQNKYRATGTGERVVYLDERPAYIAKKRWSMPHEIYIGQDETWSAFHYELNKATAGRYELPAALAGQQ